MSAIAGIYYLDGRRVKPEDLDRMLEKLAHRGQDAAGVWHEGPAGLAHRMLWTTPESLGETLPLQNRRGDRVLTADARLDNREELINELGFPGQPAKDISDSQLILSAYEKWGEECPNKLLGDFAFAVWDNRQQNLFCVRDHFGVKPFYYYSSENLFVFASEIKALFCLPEVPKKLNEIMVGDYLVGNFEDREITFYQKILRLPAAHVMVISPDKISIRSYWSLDPSRELRFKSDAEYAENFRDLFTETVRCRLRSAYPVGSLLSGGLDSSSISCVARNLYSKNGGHRLRAFSAVYDAVPDCDERAYIQSALDQGGFDPHYARPDEHSPFADLEKIFYHQDEAFLVPNLPAMFWKGLYALAQGQGVRILLAGEDGDTTVSHGLTYVTELVKDFRFKTAIAEIYGISKHSHKSASHILREYAISPFVPRPLQILWRKLHKRDPDNESFNRTIRPAFAEKIRLKERMRESKFVLSKPLMTEREQHHYELSSGFNQYVFEVLAKTDAVFSIESRYPFFDKRLAEFCLALPPNQKLSKGWSRAVLRRAMQNILPENIQWRHGKSNLGPNLARGLWAERDRFKNVIAGKSRMIDNYVDSEILGDLYQGFASGKGTPRENWILYQAIILELWFNQAGLN